jgi:hypothetical protein
MSVPEAYLKAKENIQAMANSREVKGLEWAFYLSTVGFVSFALLSVTFWPGFISGFLASLAIDSAVLAYRSLMEYK